MTKLGLLVVLVEICGIWFYYDSQNYLGVLWCTFWIIGVIWYENFYYKRYMQRVRLRNALIWRSIIRAIKRKNTDNSNRENI